MLKRKRSDEWILFVGSPISACRMRYVVQALGHNSFDFTTPNVIMNGIRSRAKVPLVYVYGSCIFPGCTLTIVSRPLGIFRYTLGDLTFFVIYGSLQDLTIANEFFSMGTFLTLETLPTIIQLRCRRLEELIIVLGEPQNYLHLYQLHEIEYTAVKRLAEDEEKRELFASPAICSRLSADGFIPAYETVCEIMGTYSANRLVAHDSFAYHLYCEGYVEFLSIFRSFVNKFGQHVAMKCYSCSSFCVRAEVALSAFEEIASELGIYYTTRLFSRKAFALRVLKSKRSDFKASFEYFLPVVGLLNTITLFQCDSFCIQANTEAFRSFFVQFVKDHGANFASRCLSCTPKITEPIVTTNLTRILAVFGTTTTLEFLPSFGRNVCCSEKVDILLCLASEFGHKHAASIAICGPFFQTLTNIDQLRTCVQKYNITFAIAVFSNYHLVQHKDRESALLVLSGANITNPALTLRLMDSSFRERISMLDVADIILSCSSTSLLSAFDTDFHSTLQSLRNLVVSYGTQNVVKLLSNNSFSSRLQKASKALASLVSVISMTSLLPLFECCAFVASICEGGFGVDYVLSVYSRDSTQLEMFANRRFIAALHIEKYRKKIDTIINAHGDLKYLLTLL
jgi:hypothetical protein